MSQNSRIYHFGRLHLVGVLDNKRQIILNSLQSDVTDSQGKFKYGFFDVQEISMAHEQFVFGRLVKYKDILEAEVANEQLKRLVEEEVGDGVVSKSNFFLHFRTSSIAYNPIANRISDQQFRTMFVRLLKKGQGNFFFDGDMETIDEDIKIRDSIFSLDKIEKISLNLFPTNPSSRDIYRRLDDRLHDLNAKKMQQTIYAEPEGFNKGALEEDESYRGVVMAADGYGHASVHGVKDGRKVVVYTNSAPVLREVTHFEEPNLILEQLLTTFREIWTRIEK